MPIKERKRLKTKITSKKRLLFIQSIYLLAFIILIVRLFYIQITKHNFYNKEVIKQRQVTIPINSGRGTIYDRNFIKLTDQTEQKVAIILPQYFALKEENISFLQSITGEPYHELFNKIKNSKSIIEFPLKKQLNLDYEKNIHIGGLFILNKPLRYSESGLLSHTIGYINQTDFKGIASIEKALDGTLSGNPNKTLIATLDGRKQILPGEGYIVANNIRKSENLRLTIDYNIQNIVEKIIDEENNEGAIVISNVQTGEILAIVSRPNFNPNNILEHLNSNGDELYNKAIQMAFPPGSIFKIIVAAEALRQNPSYTNEIFYCAGYELIGDLEIKCSSYASGGHGEITLDNAFAQSCNSVFIQLAEKVGTKNIVNMAEKLGFNKIVDIGLMEEVSGNIPKGNNIIGPAIGNIALGQGEILVTPLQVNQLTQLIGNNGLKKPLYIMKDIVDNNFTTLKTANIQQEEQALSPEIAKRIKLWMKKVMLEGTGQNKKVISNITAGKTGSAEAVEKGKKVVHAWFTGYYPTDEPKYAITVFIQRGNSGSKTAVPIFLKIVEEMINKGFI